MKTSNKTNSRLAAIVAAMMVMSLVTLNLNAQKSFNDNSLAYLGRQFLSSSKNEIINAVSELKYVKNDISEETIEEWMTSPSEWLAPAMETPAEDFLIEENEIVMESWMQNPSEWSAEFKTLLTDLSFEENEMLLESWMMEINWSNSLMEQEMQLEEWMANPESWNSSN